jgi:hypothetical protein
MLNSFSTFLLKVLQAQFLSVLLGVIAREEVLRVPDEGISPRLHQSLEAIKMAIGSCYV